ncbi:MAG: ribosome biogenesis GTP-binding protein YihA/YsxC [Succinivibrio sp.]|nr:ribosome biogenesis GTP-binding protein YihA/YsxC [Succinivibrio sp.]
MSNNDQLDFRQTKFLVSAQVMHTLPQDQSKEIAFVGRSNSGKSSAINAICDQKNLAKTSSTPGRTQLINFFGVAPGKIIVDLPGYGYAKVPEKMKKQWQTSMAEYLQKRQNLIGLVLTMDIRHPLKDLDRMVLDWSVAAQLHTLILLTKSDKLGTTSRQEAISEVNLALSEFESTFMVIPFSALKKTGVTEARNVLQQWFNSQS